MASRRERKTGRAGGIKHIEGFETGNTVANQGNSEARWRPAACSADTLGILADLEHPEGLELAQATVRETGDKDLRNLVIMAQALGTRYVVAAGRFNGKGIFGAMCANELDVAASYQMANDRMDEIGSRTTAWLAKPDSLAAALKQRQGSKPRAGGEDEQPSS
jgi:hypothetical protein